MSAIDQITKFLLQEWGAKTLEDFRVEAEREATSIKFESVRAPNGQRFILVVCVADIDQITRLETLFKFAEGKADEDWDTITLADLFRRSRTAGGFAHESRRDEFGRRMAVVLISAEPRSMQILETAFKLK